MKIVQICPFFYPARGGVEEHVFQISKKLAKMGHKVFILTSDSLRNGKIGVKTENLSGIRIYRFSVFLSLGEFGKIWPGFILNLLKEKYDIVHVHNYRHFHTILAALICKIRGIPCVITTHSPFHPLRIRSTLSKIFVVFYDNFLKFLVDRLFSKIINITDIEAKYFKHLDKKKMAIIPNGISGQLFRRIKLEKHDIVYKKFSIKKDERVILFVGRVHPTKNIEFIIATLKNLKEKKIKTLIVGPIEDKRYFDYLITKINRHGLSSTITFTGTVDEEEKIALYDIAKIFILPSIYEPFGIVILEAFARGKPVIAVDSDGPRYLIKNGENGFLVRYGDIESAAKYIQLLLKDKKLYKKISRNNIKKAKQFTWDKIAKKIIRVYEEITKRQNR